MEKEIKKKLIEYLKDKKVYNILDNLCKRLQDNYNDCVEFEQKEEDRLVIANILDILNGHNIDL